MATCLSRLRVLGKQHLFAHHVCRFVRVRKVCWRFLSLFRVEMRKTHGRRNVEGRRSDGVAFHHLYLTFALDFQGVLHLRVQSRQLLKREGVMFGQCRLHAGLCEALLVRLSVLTFFVALELFRFFAQFVDFCQLGTLTTTTMHFILYDRKGRRETIKA